MTINLFTSSDATTLFYVNFEFFWGGGDQLRSCRKVGDVETFLGDWVAKPGPSGLNDFKGARFRNTHSEPTFFLYPRLARVFKRAGLADLLSFGCVSQTPVFSYSR